MLQTANQRSSIQLSSNLSKFLENALCLCVSGQRVENRVSAVPPISTAADRKVYADVQKLRSLIGEDKAVLRVLQTQKHNSHSCTYLGLVLFQKTA